MTSQNSSQKSNGNWLKLASLTIALNAGVTITVKYAFSQLVIVGPSAENNESIEEDITKKVQQIEKLTWEINSYSEEIKKLQETNYRITHSSYENFQSKFASCIYGSQTQINSVDYSKEKKSRKTAKSNRSDLTNLD